MSNPDLFEYISKASGALSLNAVKHLFISPIQSFFLFSLKDCFVDYGVGTSTTLTPASASAA